MATRLRSRRARDRDVRPGAPDSTAGVARRAARASSTPPRVVWLMVPGGRSTESTFQELLAARRAGRRDRRRRQLELPRLAAPRTPRRPSAASTSSTRASRAASGGSKVGYCLMVGGDDEAVARLEPVFTALAPEDGYAHVGPSGAGHFVKMVHNGIEYGMMQAYAEGFEILKQSEFDLDLREIAGIWRYGSVVRSWLLELLRAAFETEDGDLDRSGLRRGLRRGPLDGRRGDRRGRAGARDHGRAVRALRLAPGRVVRGQGERRAAQRVRRPRRPRDRGARRRRTTR